MRGKAGNPKNAHIDLFATLYNNSPCPGTTLRIARGRYRSQHRKSIPQRTVGSIEERNSEHTASLLQRCFSREVMVYWDHTLQDCKSYKKGWRNPEGLTLRRCSRSCEMSLWVVKWMPWAVS